MNIYPARTKIWFDGERHAYTVQACDDRYLICTKPYNLQHTVMHTIVDLEEEVRGPSAARYINYETQEGCEKALEWLRIGSLGISYNDQIPLKIKRTEWTRLT